MTKLIASLTVFLASFGLSQAATVVFDFADGGELDGQTSGAIMSRSESGETVVLTTLTITAPDFGVLPGGDPYTNLTTAGHETNIASNGGSGGLGINNDTTSNSAFNTETGAGSSESSNINYLESVTFEFDQTVTITTIDLASMGSGEFLRINIEGNATNFDLDDSMPSDIWADPLGGLVIAAGTNITFTGLGGAGDTNFRVDEFTVDVVPEPSGILLTLLGGALCLMRRRRKGESI